MSVGKTITMASAPNSVTGMPPDFLNLEGDAAAEVHRCVFLAHAEALVVFSGLK
jgi:hypothetical protein